jgi:hypothetical protein
MSVEFAIYPNPSADEIRWNTPQNFRLYDVQGNLVMQGKNQVSADIRKLAPGNYFVVFGNNKGVKIEKI